MDKIIAVVPAADRWGHRHWARHVTSVDTTKTNGFAFDGEWLRVGGKAELPVGAIVLAYSEAGGRRKPCPIAKLFRLAANGDFEVAAEAQGEDWALDLRDKAAALVNQCGKDGNPLAAFTDEELIAELRRRGIAVGG